MDRMSPVNYDKTSDVARVSGAQGQELWSWGSLPLFYINLNYIMNR